MPCKTETIPDSTATCLLFPENTDPKMESAKEQIQTQNFTLPPTLEPPLRTFCFTFGKSLQGQDGHIQQGMENFS